MKGLSRVRGNSHARFLGEGLAAMLISYPIYPRPPRGGRPGPPIYAPSQDAFLSTPSARRATYIATGIGPLDRFLSTPSARRATPAPVAAADTDRISIHALREEGDIKHG